MVLRIAAIAEVCKAKLKAWFLPPFSFIFNAGFLVGMWLGGESFMFFSFFMQHGCLHAHSGQSTCVECLNCISVLFSSHGYYRADSSSCGFSGQKHMHRWLGACLACWSYLSHLLLQHCGHGVEVLPGELEALPSSRIELL